MDLGDHPPGRWRVDVEGRRADVDLEEVEGDAGEILALVRALRQAVAAGHRVEVHACPQMLAHTLYKAGILAAGGIALVSVRDEEPYG
ncbi:MAG: hypothetical protein H6711_02850 [Myxococcales bacterium]|nr:hypothetical protein [Myxococcales bacterium]